MRIDYVQDDDWAGIYVDDQLTHQDHAIRDDYWIELIKDAWSRTDEMICVNRWWVSLVDNDMRHMPQTFTELQTIVGTGLEAG